jgi:hypothetical protein
MIHLKRAWFDFMRPKDWYWIYKIRRTIWKIKDYDRLEHDYCCVLCHATGSRMSKPNYHLNTIYLEIDEAQSETYYGIVKDDILTTIEAGGDIEEIKEYVENLVS